jgi:hypothetical protein
MRSLWLTSVLLLAATAHAQPDFSRLEVSHGVPVCPDAKQADAWYFLPNDLAIRKGPDGKPALRFVMMRYTGTAAAGDQGRIRHRNIFQIDVAMTSRNADSLARVKADLRRTRPRLSFGPLPVRRVDAMVQYAGVGDTSGTTLGRADLESDPSSAGGGSNWQERTFTLTVDNLTAQTFAQSLRNGMLTLSVGYAFYSRGKIQGSAVFAQTGSSTPRFRRMMEALVTPSDSDSDSVATGEALAHAGAFSVDVDSSDYDRCVKQIDLNESIPPGYSVLSIYDYDFNNEIRPDLFEKLIEIEAVGAGGGRVQASAAFRFDQPEIYRRSVRFRYAVQLGRPYRYRVREIDQDGGEKVSSWVSVSDWTPILDVTTRR